MSGHFFGGLVKKEKSLGHACLEWGTFVWETLVRGTLVKGAFLLSQLSQEKAARGLVTLELAPAMDLAAQSWRALRGFSSYHPAQLGSVRSFFLIGMILVIKK